MATIRRDLFLQIGGSASGLQDVAKVARTALLGIGKDSADAITSVENAWANLGKGRIADGVKEMDRSLTRTLAAFRANAQKVIDAPTPAAATQILNVAGIEQAAKAAEAKAASYSLLAKAASEVAQREGTANAEARIAAVALAAEATEARNAAIAIRAKANALGAIATEAGIAGHQEDSLNEAHGRMGTSGMMAEHVVRSLSDSIAAGQSPVRALTMEMGRITEAMTLYAQQTNSTEGAMGKFAAFMGSGGGMAISVGAAVLTPLIADLIENKKDADEAKKALEEYARFMDDLGNFVDKATGKIVDQNKALIEGAKLAREGQAHTAAESTTKYKKQAFDEAQSMASKKVYDPESRLGARSYQTIVDPKIQGVISQANGDLNKLLAGLKALSSTNPHYDNIYRAVLQLGAQALKSNDDFHKLKGEIAELNTVAAGGTVNSSKLVQQRVHELNATTAVEKATARLNAVKERGAAIDRMYAGPARTKALDRYQVDLDAATKAVGRAKENAKSARGAATAGNRATDLAYMKAFLQRELPGVRITSTNTGKHVANSDHYADRAIDFVPSGGMGSMSKAQVRALFESHGVRIRRNAAGVEQLFGPGDKGHDNHFHVAWEGRAPTAASLDKHDQSAADKATRDAEAYAQLISRAREETLKLTRDGVNDQAAAAQLDRQAIELERQRLNGAAQAGADERKWTKAKADELKFQNDINADLKTRALDRAEQSRKLEAGFQTSEHARAARVGLLQIDLDMADTRRERLKLERTLLADAQDARRAALQKIIDDPSRSTGEKTLATADLGRLPAQDAAERTRLEGRYQSPLANYRDDLKKNVGDLGDALQNVGVGGLQSVQDALFSIMSGTKSAANAFREMAYSIVSDLEKIAMQKLILMIFGLKDGGLVSGFSGGGIPGFADGGQPMISNGRISGPGTGTSDSILAAVGGRRLIRVANGESINTAESTKRNWPIIDAMNKGRLPRFAGGGLVDSGGVFLRPLPSTAAIARRQPTVQQHFHINAQGAILANDLVAEMHRVGAAAMIGGAQQAQQDMTDNAMARFPS